MKGCGLQPNVITYTSLMSACAKGGQVDKAYEAFTEMKQRGLLPDAVTSTVLMNACAKAGKTGMVYEVCAEMKRAPISTREQGGNIVEVSNVIVEMSQGGLLPLVPSHNATASSCEKDTVADNAREVLAERRQSGLQSSRPRMEGPCNTLMKTLEEGKHIVRVPAAFGEVKQRREQGSKRLQKLLELSTQPRHSCLHDFIQKFKCTPADGQFPSFAEEPPTLAVKQNSGLQDDASMIKRTSQGVVCTEGYCPDAVAMVGSLSGHEHQNHRYKPHRDLAEAAQDLGNCAENGDTVSRLEETLNSWVQYSISGSSRNMKTANNKLRLTSPVSAQDPEEALPSFGGKCSGAASCSRDRAHSKMKVHTSGAYHQEVATPPGFEDCLPVPCKATNSRRRCPNKMPLDEAL
eukprot:TRINITY_DN9177_c0_g2_i7.p1 TRINITY_DN9177_c0_g2~~TRINITY_DN9177_c0_g2_i7.p1  ORF type:complete len:405 (-),score=62.53 TRINITY_DN9177_c0_g2_i7:306-1520(-)